MQNKKITCLLVMLVLLAFPATNIAKPNQVKPNQDPTLRLFLELVRTGYDMVDDPIFVEIHQLLNSILTRERDYELRIKTVNTSLIINDTINNIDWEFAYDDFYPLVSARRVFLIDISENQEIKIAGATSSISNLQNLARDYIFYPDSESKKIVCRNEYIEGIGNVETSLAAPIINLHLPKKGTLSISDWRFFFDCLHEFVELYEDERNKTSLRIFNKDYLSISLEEKDKIQGVVGYNLYIHIIQ